MATPDPFEPYPFMNRDLGDATRINAYIITAADGKKSTVEAANVSLAIKQSGIVNPIFAKRKNPMAQALINLSEFTSDQKSA